MKKGTDPKDALAALRTEVEALDAKTLVFLTRRMALARRIGAAKRAAGLRLRDVRREGSVVTKVTRTGKAMGLPEESLRAIFTIIVDMCRNAQEINSGGGVNLTTESDGAE